MRHRAVLLSLAVAVCLALGAGAPVDAAVRHPAPTMRIAPMSGPPGTTIRVTGRLATADSCARMVVTLSHGASGVGDVQRVPVVGGRFHAAVDLATSAPP